MKTLKKIFTLQKLNDKELFWFYFVIGVISTVNLTTGIIYTNWFDIIIGAILLLISTLTIFYKWTFK